jgi:hypothetical protein
MRRILAVPVAVAAVLLAAGCTDSRSPGLATANGSHPSAASSAENDPVAFARCMRGHGQQVPDPAPGGSWQFDPHPRGASAAWNNALQACQHFIPNFGSGAKPRSQQEMEQLRQFAICLRANGIDASDPQVGGDRPGNIIIGGRLGNLNRTQVEADPGYKAAMAACKDKLPNESKPGASGAPQGGMSARPGK